MTAPSDNDIGTKAAVVRRQSAAEKRQARIDLAVRGLMSTPDGRSWVRAKLAAWGVFVAAPPEDALRMAFAQGLRNAGLELLADVTRAAPGEYLLMNQERANG